MNKKSAQAFAAVLCRAIDYYQVSKHPVDATGFDIKCMENAEFELAEALEAVNFDAEDDPEPNQVG